MTKSYSHVGSFNSAAHLTSYYTFIFVALYANAGTWSLMH